MSEKELEQFTSRAKSITPDDHVRHTPPEDLWERIESGIAETPRGEANESLDLTGDTARTNNKPAGAGERNLPVAEELPGGDPRFSPRFALIAVAAVLAIFIGGALLTTLIGGESFDTYETEIANTDLPEPFDGTATVSLEVDDNPMLVVDFTTEFPSSEPVEIWIGSADGTEFRSIGIVESGNTTWDWPADLNPQQYPLIDLSFEPDDGNPAHSGRSILRGALTRS